MTFSFFLSIYPRRGAPASWAARHTIAVCLVTLMYSVMFATDMLFMTYVPAAFQSLIVLYYSVALIGLPDLVPRTI